MKNKIIERRAALEAALETVRFQIKNLKKHFSKEQVRCWYVHRDSLLKSLAKLPTEEIIQRNAKRVNYSNSSKIKLLNK
jgi:hypothetical protein